MNGWQRLWVVLSLVLAIGAGLVTDGAMPSEERLTSIHKTLLAGYARDMKAISNATDEDTKRFYRETVGTLEDVGRRFNEENKNHERRLKELPGERRDFIIYAASVWLAICIAIYVAGWLMGWVYRGFRPKEA